MRHMYRIYLCAPARMVNKHIDHAQNTEWGKHNQYVSGHDCSCKRYVLTTVLYHNPQRMQELFQ